MLVIKKAEITETIEVKPIEFIEIRVPGQHPLFISQDGGRFKESMLALDASGLRPLSEADFLTYRKTLVEQLAGKWFYISYAGTLKAGRFTFNDHEFVEIKKGIRRKVKPEETIEVYIDSNPMHIDIYSQVYSGRKFALASDRSETQSEGVAPVIVGIRSTDRSRLLVRPSEP